MSKWSRILRGMVGMGLTFSAGAFAIMGSLAVVLGIVGGFSNDLLRLAFGSAVWAFPIGVVTSGVLSLTSRHLRFDELSLPRFASFGALGGLALWTLMGATGAWAAWSLDTAIVNAVVLVGIGTGAAAGALVLARKAQPALTDGEGADAALTSGDSTGSVDDAPVDGVGLTEAEKRELLGDASS